MTCPLCNDSKRFRMRVGTRAPVRTHGLSSKIPTIDIANYKEVECPVCTSTKKYKYLEYIFSSKVTWNGGVPDFEQISIEPNLAEELGLEGVREMGREMLDLGYDLYFFLKYKLPPPPQKPLPGPADWMGGIGKYYVDKHNAEKAPPGVFKQLLRKLTSRIVKEAPREQEGSNVQ